jgi:ComF family protein
VETLAQREGFRAPGRLARAVVDFVLPPRCLGCQRRLSDHDAICGACWREVRFIRAPLCDRLGQPLPFDTGELMVSAAAEIEPPDYDRARAVAHFGGRLRRMVHQLKYHDRHDAVGLFARWMVEAGQELFDGCDAIVPVPLARRRLIWRRFNQSALLANEIGRRTDLPVRPFLLERRRQTAAQVGLSEAQRRLNVRGAFKVPGRGAKRLAGRNVLLIDDVITTGATVNACARALKRAGAARVDVLAIGLVTADSALFETI